MNKNHTSTDITRREALKSGAGVVAGSLAVGLSRAMAADSDKEKTSPSAERPGADRDWSKVRGFNYQPSWGSNDISIWCHFREDLFARELDLGKKHFPGIDVLRIWFSPNAWLSDRDAFLAAAGRAMELMTERSLQMIPVYFNGWHSYPAWGGFTQAQLRRQSDNDDFKMFRQYTRELHAAIADRGTIMLQDVANEPFNLVGGDKDRVELFRRFLGVIAGELHSLAPRTPVSVGTQGQSPYDLGWVDTLVDVHAIHPYVFIPGDAEKTAAKLKKFEACVERLKKFGKPALATECCWGSNDDTLRAEAVRAELGLLKRHGIGFLPHALHHSAVADLHRPHSWQTWSSMYMGFIEPDGSIRPGHEVYNEF
jgi:hypothetical protein